MASSWRTLKLSNASVPHLLVKVKLDPVAGYTIQLTDLSRIWSESLTKREIVRRAIKEDCSIDPSEGDDQYKILLEKIEQAIGQQDGTSLKLQPAARDDGGLLLTLSAPLPAPLPEFRWDLTLALLPPQHVDTELVTPLLRQANSLQAQIQALVHELHDKDRVISKVTDRLESSGNDLTTVFPGVSNVKLSRKKSQREQLARHVRGLADFDESDWRSGQRDSDGDLGVDEIDAILASLAPASRTGDDGAGSEWWRSIGEGFSAKAASIHDGSGRSVKRVNGHAIADEDVEMQDEQFQRQSTPPHIRPRSATPPPLAKAAVPSPTLHQNTQVPTVADDESTEDDEDDLDAPPRKAASSQPPTSTVHSRQRTTTPDTVASSPRGVSRTDERKVIPSPAKELSPELHKQPTPPPKPRGKLGAIGGRAKPSATPEPAHGAAAAPASKAKGKLGAIGGKTKSSAAAPSPASEPAASPTKPHKLGTIGGKKTAATGASTSRAMSEDTATSAQGTPPPRQSRAPEKRPANEPTPPRETSQERADKKREELKRQLEEKSKAPVKKKRKF